MDPLFRHPSLKHRLNSNYMFSYKDIHSSIIYDNFTKDFSKCLRRYMFLNLFFSLLFCWSIFSSFPKKNTKQAWKPPPFLTPTFSSFLFINRMSQTQSDAPSLICSASQNAKEAEIMVEESFVHHSLKSELIFWVFFRSQAIKRFKSCVYLSFTPW